MAGRTSLMADKALNLYRDIIATPPAGTWVTLFTTSPTSDHPTTHGGVEWGPSRIRVFPNSGAGAPFWGAPEDKDPFIRQIKSQGSVVWNSIVLTTSPSVVRSAGVFDAVTGGNLLTWYPLVANVTVTDGESHVFGTAAFRIEGD